MSARPASKITRAKVIILDGAVSHMVSSVDCSLGLGLTNSFCKGPDGKYLKSCEQGSLLLTTLLLPGESSQRHYIKE